MNYPAPAFEAKICPPAQLTARVAKLARPLVFTNGCFDILHRGHVTYLAQAATLGADMEKPAPPSGPSEGLNNLMDMAFTVSEKIEQGPVELKLKLLLSLPLQNLLL